MTLLLSDRRRLHEHLKIYRAVACLPACLLACLLRLPPMKMILHFECMGFLCVAVVIVETHRTFLSFCWPMCHKQKVILKLKFTSSCLIYR